MAVIQSHALNKANKVTQRLLKYEFEWLPCVQRLDRYKIKPLIDDRRETADNPGGVFKTF